MICILTRERHVKSQLSLLLRDLSYTPVFFESLASYVDEPSVAESRQPVLLDLALPDSEKIASGIKQVSPNTCVIGFVCFDPSTHAGEPPAKPESLDGFFLLPSRADRAKVRIISALRAQDTRAPIRRGMSHSLYSTLLKRPGATFAGGAKRTAVSSDTAEIISARYLEVKSVASRSFVHHMRRIDPSVPFIILKGKEGAEFELAARELNYQNNADAEQLFFGDSDGLRMESLELIEKEAVKERKKRFCYMGCSAELSLQSAKQLVLFVDFLNHLRNPHLRVIMAHEDGSEAYLQGGVEAVLKPFFSRAIILNLPGLDERMDDIRPISIALIANLRAAHPFLRVKGLSEEAIQHLTGMRHELSYAKLCRILRNACALCQREQLSMDDLRNYEEHETTTCHLVESMADEQFFPS
jgi:hypothetical protein